MRMTILGSIACAALTCAASSAAGEGSAEAEALFVEAKKLMAAGDLAHACPKFAESQRLDPGSGTLAALAMCHELRGLTATAWSEYSDLIAAAQAAKRPDREEFGRQRKARLEAILSHLTVTVTAEAQAIPNLVVQLDGIPMGAPSWGLALPIDPGDHRVEAVAPGYRPWSVHVTVGPKGDAQSISVPRLQPAPIAEAPPPPPAPAPAAPPPVLLAPPPPGDSQRAVSFLLGGAGIAALGAGSYFGVEAIDKAAEVKRACPVTQCPDPATVALAGTARTDAAMSDVLMGAGLAAVAAGAILYLTDHPRPAMGLTVAPAVGGVTGLVARGEF